MNPRELQIRQPRAIRVADAPTLSVVMVSEAGRSQLRACLESLLPACNKAEAQLVVIRAAEAEDIWELRRAFPAVRFATAPAGSDHQDMKAIGIKAADGDIVLFQPETPLDGPWIPPRAFER